MTEIRTFEQICSGMSKRDIDSLSLDLRKCTKVSDTAIWFWMHGRRRPQALYQDKISESLKRVCGIIAKPETLFPES